MNKVCIVCITYNHSQYIKDCLEGFINQKTNFKYKVIVHDDASTDGTAEIVKEYVDKYPDIITAILEKENQYSKAVPFFQNLILPLLDCDYVALCEGDDYWCDNNKLQKQADFLDKNPDYSLCVHNTLMKDMEKHIDRVRYTNIEKDIYLDDVVMGGGTCFHTSSILCRREFFEVPNFFRVKGIGDYSRSIYFALCGKIHYLPEVMSVYRFCCPGSWSKRQTYKSSIENYNNLIKMLNRVNEHYDFKYNDSFKKGIRKQTYLLLKLECNRKEIKRNYNDFFKKETTIDKIKFYLKCMFPSLVNRKQ